MSYVNGTTHYNLPQTVGTDKRDWTDTNQAFADVDAALYNAATAASGAASDIATLDNQINGTGGIDSRLTTAENDIGTINGEITTLQSTVGGHTAAIADVRADLQDAICTNNEPTATAANNYSIGDYFFYNDILYVATAAISIGDSIIPNTNCRATTVTYEMLNGGIDAAAVDYDNTVSGLLATKVQAAIDEVNANLAGKLSISSMHDVSYQYVDDSQTGTVEDTLLRMKNALAGATNKITSFLIVPANTWTYTGFIFTDSGNGFGLLIGLNDTSIQMFTIMGTTVGIHAATMSS